MCKCVFSSNNTTTNYYYHYYYYSEYLALFIQTTQGMFAVLAIKGWVWVHVQSLSCLTLCDPVDCIPPGSSFQRISQATILEWVAISSSRGSSQPRDQTQVSCLSGRFFTTEAPGKLPSLGKNWVLEILAVTFFFFSSLWWIHVVYGCGHFCRWDYLVRTSTLYKRACREVARAAMAAISSRAAGTVSTCDVCLFSFCR